MQHEITVIQSITWTLHSTWTICTISLATNLITKYSITIKTQITYPTIFKQIPLSTEKRISTLSSNKTIFKESKEISQKALEKSGYRQTLKYHTSNENVSYSKENRKRNVIWLNVNPPILLISKQKSEIIFWILWGSTFRHFTKLANCLIATTPK